VKELLNIAQRQMQMACRYRINNSFLHTGRGAPARFLGLIRLAYHLQDETIKRFIYLRIRD